MIRQAPKLVDRHKNPLDTRVGNGSNVRVQYKEWESTWKGQVFKGLDFQAMQVVDLVEVIPRPCGGVASFSIYRA